MKYHTFYRPLLLLLFILSACQGEAGTSTPGATTPLPATLPAAAGPTEPPTAGPSITAGPQVVSPLGPGLVSGTDGMPWWNDAVFYEVFVRSFYDSDGDGVGDLNGLIARLDYLNDGDPAGGDDLGVTGIWLMPIMESPSYHGYDVVDYYQVDEEYGTQEDFQRFMEEAHARGIRVIVDLVLNHTGRDHPWFQESLDPASDLRDWYVWAEESPGYTGPWGQQVWHSSAGSYYYGVFWDGMPDLNYANPEVTTQMQDVSRFWLEEMGVDGFRLDAIKHLVEDGAVQENTPATHAWFEGYYDFYKSVNPDAFTVGEAWSSTAEVVKYVGDEVDLAFEFDLAGAILDSARYGRKESVLLAYQQVVAAFPAGQYAVFLANHDQNRAMTQLAIDESAAKVAATLLLTSPGVPFIYYGEEIGMLGRKPDEDIRLPMQWSAGEGAGFTTGQPWRPPHRTYDEVNVAGQSQDPGSLLNHYQALITLRNNHEALRVGDWLLVETPVSQVYAFLRTSDGETVLVLLNLGREPISDYTLDLAEGPLAGPLAAVSLLGDATPLSPTITASGGFANYQPISTLPPQTTFIIQLLPQ
ncbi:MAG: alpha-amylase [Chloroflexi bacterium]|nr:alpha-amylase [Chloroflexota bacterium]